MGFTDKNSTLNSIVAYTPYSQEHALTVLRISGPLVQAGMKFIPGDDDPEQVSLGDAVLIQRDFPNLVNRYEKIISRARGEGKPLIYEIDDLLFELPEKHPYRPVHYFTPALLPMLRAVVEADLVTTTTPLLREYLLPFNPNTWVLPNYLNDQLWNSLTPKPKRAKTPIVLGYMGSDSHLSDLEQITPVFKRLLKRYGENIMLKFWGGPPPEIVRHHPNVKWIPLELSDYSEFARYFSQQESDIFISPLSDSLFNQCKSPIKFLEYSSLGVPGVYSRLAPYEDVLTNGQNGFLASTLDEWETCLVQLIENPSLRHKMGQKAQQVVREKWLLSQHGYKWKEVYRKALNLPPDANTKQITKEQKKIIVEIARQIQEWQSKLQNKLDKEQQHAQALSAQLDEIVSSDAWRLVNLCWSIRLKIAPHGSRRERFVQKMFQILRKRVAGE